MKFAKIMVIIVIFVFAVSVSCAADTNNASISEDNSQMLLSLKNEITDDTSENSILAQTNNDETLSAQKNSEILRANEGTYEDLRNDINYGGIFRKSYYRYQPGDGDTIEIKNSITIDGNGVVIDMQGSNIRAFSVTTGGVIFKNLTIKNVNCVDNGGAIYFIRDGTVENCNFIGNTVDGGAGGAVFILNEGNVRNCNFAANQAGSGGAVFFAYGGTVSNCNFTDNQADYGGAVLFYNYGTVSNCNFTDNQAGSGGAVYFDSSSSVINCNFAANNATNGGAIYFKKAISNSNINATFISNKAEQNGGAINFEGMVSNSNIAGTYINNKAEQYGGANYFNNKVSDNSKISGTYNNNIARSGGANFFNGNVSNLNVSGTYADNKATIGGGGANFFYDKVSDNSKISGTYNNNTAGVGGANYFQNNVLDSNIAGTYANNTAKGDGGANSFQGSVSDSNVTGTYTNNTATFGGGANSFMGSVSGSNVTGTYTNNKATIGGGGANYFNNKVSSNSKISGNYNNNNAKQNGGANYFYGAVEYAIIDGVYENNKAKGPKHGDGGGANYFNDAVEYTIIDGTYTNNTAKYFGGANNFKISVLGLNIGGKYTNNKAEMYGGANMFLVSVSGSNVTGTYTNNTAAIGGANYFWNSVLYSNILGTYTNNTAAIGGANHFHSVSGSNVTGTYTNNTAEDYGGANHFSGEVSCSNVTGTYINNNASHGGANYFLGSVSDSNVTGTYTNNNATSGGANRFYSVSGSNVAGTYTNNTAEQNGGANFFYEVLDSTVTGTYINNTANIGTIFFYNNEYHHCDVEIKNAIFLNNKCEYEISANLWHSDIVVNDCWFGNNASNFKDKPANKINNVIMGNWLFLNATADYNSLLVMDSTNITFKLNSTDGTRVFGFDNSKLPVVNLTLTASNGDVDKTTTLGRAVKYMATKYGKGSVTASIENAEYTIFLENRLNPEFSAEVNPQEIDYGNNTKIFLSYNDTATGTVNITFTGKKHNHKIENVDLNKTIQLPNTILPDEYKVTVTYSGDKVFANASATSTLKVNQLKSDIKVVGHDIYVNETQGLMFNVTLPENATGNLTINGTIILNVTKEGRKENNSLIIDIMNNAYPIGKYEWTFNYSGDDIYKSSEETSVANISITPTEITANVTSKLFVDNTTQVSYNLTPDGAVGDIVFTSNDTGVVEVDQNGNIKAIAEGTALITVTFEGSENYTASSTNITITVSKIPTEINITNATVELKALQNISGLASLNPAEAGNLTYTSSDEDIVLVSDDGIIYARIKGTATVTVSFAGDGKYKAAQNKTIEVTVTLNDASIRVENDTLDLFIDDTFTIVANTTPKGLKVTYKPDNSGIISVDNNGVVTALKEGNSTIIVSVGDNKVYAENTTTVTVTVRKIPTEIIIANETLNIKVNDKVDSGAGLNPSEAGNLTYTISETSIIKLLDNQIIALSEGSATITYSFAGNDKYAAAQNKTITVKVSLNDASVRVNNNTLNLLIDDTFTIIATTVPDGLNVTYMPDNSGIINVDENGLVTALKEGTASIIVKVGGDGVYAENTTIVTVTVKKVNPTMDATADEITEGENATINIELPIDATGNVTTTVNGNTYFSPVDNGKSIIIIPDLEYGNYTLPVTYSGNDKYNSLTKDVNLTVKEDEIIVSAPDLTKYYSGHERFTANVAYANGRAIAGKEVKVSINGVTYKRTTDENGSASLSINLNSATYDTVVEVDNITVNSLVTILPTIEAEDVESKSKNIVFTATFLDGEGNYLTNGTNVSFNIGGVIYNSQVTGDKGLASVDLVLNHGRFIITSYNSVSNENVSNSIAVDLKDVDMILSGDEISVGENATIDVTLPDDATGNVTAAINGKTYTSQVDNGKANIIIPDLSAGNYTAHVTYSGDNNYNHATGNVSISVSKIDPIIDIEDDIITVGENATVTVILPNDATGNVRIGNEIVPLKNGTASAILTGLPVGITTIPVTYSGDDKYNPIESSADVVVNDVPAPEKANLTIKATADEITEGEDAVIVVTGLENATGNVSAVVHGHIHSAPIVDGTARITVSGLAENATASVSYAGDDIYNPAVTHVNITVNKNVMAVISAENLTKYYKDSEKFTVKITDAKGQPAANKTVEITINGITYKRTTDENGTAGLNINLNSGVYPVRVVVDGVEANFTVTVQSTIDSSDIVKIFRNGTQYNAIFTDANGTPLPSIKVSFNLHGIIYNRTTDKNGAAKLNINLDAGDYIITAFNSATGEMNSNTVKVISLIESDDLTKYFRNASQFVVRIHSADGGYVGAGEEVNFNINGVIYTRLTNATGHANLNINLHQGNYTITTYYKDCGRGNNIEVLPILSADDLVMKYMDGSQFKAKLVDGQGNPYPNKNVTFNVNGVFYSRATDSDGVAKLNIRLMAGQYIITSSYGGCNISNKITIRG